ncbi:hypothetical protein L195_g043507, partial [Trifolium pratense]
IVGIPSPDSNVSIPSPDSNVSIPSPDSDCEYSLTGFRLRSLTGFKCEYSLTGFKREYSLIGFKVFKVGVFPHQIQIVSIPSPDSNFQIVSIPSPDSNCELSLTRQIASFRSPD